MQINSSAKLLFKKDSLRVNLTSQNAKRLHNKTAYPRTSPKRVLSCHATARPLTKKINAINKSDQLAFVLKVNLCPKSSTNTAATLEEMTNIARTLRTITEKPNENSVQFIKLSP